MFGQTFYFSSFRKYIILFGTLFNDIVIMRENGDDVQVIKVPIQYANKEKMQARVDADPEIDRPFAALLPRMSFYNSGPWVYDGPRKLPTINRTTLRVNEDTNQLKYQYMPVAWNIPFRLSIYVKKAEDGTKILEQILPYFTPVWTTTINLIPEMEVNVDIPITINGVQYHDNYDDAYKERRNITWDLDFTMKAYFYGPVHKTGIIKVANTTFYIANTQDIRDSVGHMKPAERVIISPGLDANGNPVFYYGPYPANTTSIPYTDIEEDDDWGFIETTESIEKFIT